jgi:hypothetical protein
MRELIAIEAKDRLESISNVPAFATENILLETEPGNGMYPLGRVLKALTRGRPGTRYTRLQRDIKAYLFNGECVETLYTHTAAGEGVEAEVFY